MCPLHLVGYPSSHVARPLHLVGYPFSNVACGHCPLNWIRYPVPIFQCSEFATPLLKNVALQSGSSPYPVLFCPCSEKSSWSATLKFSQGFNSFVVVQGEFFSLHFFVYSQHWACLVPLVNFYIFFLFYYRSWMRCITWALSRTSPSCCTRSSRRATPPGSSSTTIYTINRWE